MALEAQTPAYLNIPSLPVEPSVRLTLEQDLREHHFDSAEALLIREIDKQPNAARLLTFLGSVFFLDRKFMNCAVAMSKAEKLGPLGEEDRFTLAMAFLAIKRSDWARPELEKLHLAHRENALYVYWLGKLDFEDQKLPTAIERFEEAIRLDPGSVKAHDMLGVSKQMAGRHEEAAKSFDEAIRLNREAASPSAWPPLDYGSMLLTVGKFQEAEPYLREAVKYEPKLAKAHYKLGSVLESENKGEEAISELKLATVLGPGDPEPWHALARVYRRQGRHDDADNAIAEFKKRSSKGKPPASPAAKRN